MQLLQLAMPNEELLHTQMKQSTETLHSDKLGDIDLPISSANTAQRIQQQQLLMMSSSHAPPTSKSHTGESSADTPEKCIYRFYDAQTIDILTSRSCFSRSFVIKWHSIGGQCEQCIIVIVILVIIIFIIT